MNHLNVFEFEALEQRFEFGFWASLWDAVCWIADSTWDVMETVWETGSLTLGWNTGTNTLTIGSTFSHFFTELGNNWSETWDVYWE